MSIRLNVLPVLVSFPLWSFVAISLTSSETLLHLKCSFNLFLKTKIIFSNNFVKNLKYQINNCKSNLIFWYWNFCFLRHLLNENCFNYYSMNILKYCYPLRWWLKSFKNWKGSKCHKISWRRKGVKRHYWLRWRLNWCKNVITD